MKLGALVLAVMLLAGCATWRTPQPDGSVKCGYVGVTVVGIVAGYIAMQRCLHEGGKG